MPFDDHLSLFEHDKITPRSEILLPLLDTFFDHFTCHFPFLSKDAVLNSVKSRKTSALLLNSMCALAARFSSVDELQSIALYQRGEAFGNRARMLLVPLMNLPSHDIVASILMITWHELAVNHDVGVWMYTGISCRMAVDLGMEKAAASEKIGEAAVVTVSSNLFWAVNLLNQIISLATGRPLTIRMDQVDVAYPEEPDCRDDKPSPFPSTIRIMQFLGLVGEAIGGEMTSAQLGYGLLPTTRDKLMRYSKAVIDYYTNIHPKLVFDIQNFRSQRDMKQSGAFLILHLWANAVMIAIHRPGLRLGQNGLLDTLVLGNESRELSISSARTISSILELAEMVDPLAVLASPFIDQAVEIAGLVFGAETKLNVANLSLVPQSHEVDRISHQSNYNTCVRTLEAVLVYWKGVGWTLTAMKQRYRGNGETDPAEESVDPNSMIVLNDTKMIQMLLEKVKATEESQGKMADTGVAIGVGVNGITDTSEGSITILGRHDPGLAAAHTSRIMDHFHIDHQNILATAPTIDVARMNPGYIGGNEDHINWSDLSVWDNVDIFQSTDNAFF